MSSRTIIAALSLTSAVLFAGATSASVLRVSYHTNNQSFTADGTAQLVELDDAGHTSVTIQPTSTQTLVFRYAAECAASSSTVQHYFTVTIWVDNHQIAPVTGDAAFCTEAVAGAFNYQGNMLQAFAGLSAGKHTVQVKAAGFSGDTIWLGNGTLSVIQ